MTKFDEAVQALLRKTNQQLKFPITIDRMLTYTSENELNSFITGYLIGSGKYEPNDDVYGYVYSLKTTYPDFGKFSNQ